MLWLMPARNWRAASFRTKPSLSMADWTLRVTSAETFCGRFSTLETVPTETPASAATSLTLAETISCAPEGGRRSPWGQAAHTQNSHFRIPVQGPL